MCSDFSYAHRTKHLHKLETSHKSAQTTDSVKYPNVN